MNQNDSDSWSSWLLEQGVTLGKTDADIVLINTCTVTDHAEKEAVSYIKKIKKDHPHTILVVTGCGVRVKQHPFSTLDGVDYILSDFSERENLRSLLPPVARPGKQEMKSKTRALIPIQNGCDNFCSFCIVPFVRGRSVSRREEDIIHDILAKEQEGYQEIIITGINIGAYGTSTSTRFQESQLGTLLQHILEQTHIPRIRLSSIGPQYITPVFLETFRNPRICNQLHLSIQSGSDTILQAMRRPYIAADILAVTELLQKTVPHLSCTADVIVGFPGETEEDFQKTCDLIEQIPVSKVHVFPYSPREGTVGATLPFQISDRIKKQRAEQLRRLGDRLRTNFQSSLIGTIQSVLFEKKMSNPYEGWSTNYVEVQVSSSQNLQTAIRRVRITRLQQEKLQGDLVD